MSAERAEILSVFQEAARIERDALVGARQKIVELLAECDEPYDYPRMAALDGSLENIGRMLTQQQIRIEAALRKEQRKDGEHERLTQLLALQSDAHEDRSELVAAREALTDDEDERFSALTREIADVDNEIVARAEEIETLAALSAVGV